MQVHSGRVADPVTGAAVANAEVFVLGAGTLVEADVFSDSQGEVPLANPVITDAAGRYSFFAPNGKYRLRILSPTAVLLYDHDDVSICDPREPRTILADETQPALSLNSMPGSGDVNLPLMIEKLDVNGDLVGARWRYQTHNTEVGFGNCYNFRRRAGDPNNQDFPSIDSLTEPVLTWGTNDADDGILTMPGFYVSGGGQWIGDAHVVTANLGLPVPQGDDPAGVMVFMNAPAGLVKGDVVALDTSARLSVKPVSILGEKLPFVVAKVDEKGTSVMVRGLAWVKVTGPVEPGDMLVTSSQSLSAEKANELSDPSRSLGVAVGQLVGDKVLVRISRRTAVEPEKRIVSFVVGATAGVIDDFNHTVTLGLPVGTDLSNLTPTVTISTDATVSPISGATVNLTNPVTYTVTAQDSSTQDYTVTVIAVPEEKTEVDITGADAFYSADQSSNRNRGDMGFLIDGNAATWSYATSSNTDQKTIIAFDLDGLHTINQLRIDKVSANIDSTGTAVDHADLEILVSTDTGALNTRSYYRVSNLINGDLGNELVTATSVNSDGTIEGEHSGAGYYTLTFNPATVTAVAISVVRSAGDALPYVHYPAYEVEAYYDPAVLPPLSAYADWATGFPGFTSTAPELDFDLDGIANLLEFVLAGNPTVHDSQSISPSLNASGTSFELIFSRSDESELQPVTVKVQTSDDLVEWTDLVTISPESGSGYTVVENGTLPDTITVTIPEGTASRQFVRVTAE